MARSLAQAVTLSDSNPPFVTTSLPASFVPCLENAGAGKVEIETVDLVSRFRCAGIASGGQDNGDRVFGIQLDFQFAETLFAHGLKNLKQRGIEQRQQHLSFGIASAHVELEDAGAFLGPHDADVKNAAEIDTFLAKSGQDRLDDLPGNLGLQFGCGEGRGCIGSHATGVQSGVPFPEAFVILRNG